MTARTAAPEERDELWTVITSRFERHARYQSRTDREIPIVVGQPA